MLLLDAAPLGAGSGEGERCCASRRALQPQTSSARAKSWQARAAMVDGGGGGGDARESLAGRWLAAFGAKMARERGREMGLHRRPEGRRPCDWPH